MLADLVRTGAPLESAHAAVILVHGRGATAESMLPLAEAVFPQGEYTREGVAFLAPQAPGNTWYPFSFLAPIAQNEPSLDNALAILADLFVQLDQGGIPASQMALVGFSQGACLSLEFAARNPRRYGGIAALSGGLIGPPGTVWEGPGSLEGSPIFLGCSDIDPHIPARRVQESAQVLEDMGAEVTTRFYDGMGHTVNEDEIIQVRQMIRQL